MPVRVTAPRLELTSHRQKVSRLPTEPPGRPVVCTYDHFLWDENIFYLHGIFPCSFAQIDETTSSSSSSRPNHAMKMMQIFRRYGGHWETVQSVAL